MAKRKKTNKKRIIIILGIIFIIVSIIYIKSWYNVTKEEKYQTSYLISTKTINLEMDKLEEIPNVMAETPSNYYIFIGYIKSKTDYNFEKKLKPIIDKYNLQDYFYYINITNMKQNKNYKDELATALNIEEIKKVPTLLYFENRELKTIYTNANDLSNDLEINQK